MRWSEYKNYFDNEKGHFYYESLHELILSLSRKFLPADRPNVKILDAGAGTGGLAVKLKSLGKVTAIDPHPLAVKYNRLRRVQIKQAKVEKIPFPNNKFDLVTCIDTLVVVKNDLQALTELLRVTKPGGILILRVSAHQWLRTGHERVVFMKRRYTWTEITHKMLEAGWSLKKTSYMHLSLLPFLWAKSLRGKIFTSNQPISNIGKVNRTINWLMLTILRLENRWLERWNLPNGIGILAIGRKPVTKYTPK